MKNTFDRRQWLSGATNAGAAAMLSWLSPRGVRAQSGTPEIPKRVVFYHSGQQHPFWFTPVAPAGMSAPTETSFDLIDNHAALKPYKDRLILLDGINYRSLELDPTQFSNAHIPGNCHCLIANNAVGPNDGNGGGISLDQAIAQHINRPTPATKLESLVFNIGGGDAPWDTTSYGGANQWIRPELDPGRIYDRLFPGGQTPAGAGDNSAAIAAARARAVQRKSVLDLVTRDLDVLKGKLGKEDRIKLQAHGDLIRSMELRLDLTGKLTALPASCQVPTKTSGARVTDYATFLRLEKNLLSLVQTALACDLTRVVATSLRGIGGDAVGYTADMHIFMHDTAGPNGKYRDDPAQMAIVKKYHQLESESFARLLQALEAVPERDGRTLLDHTMVIWASYMAGAEHSYKNHKWMVVGGPFKTARWLSLNSRSHSHVLVSVAQAMGLPGDTFGNPDAGRGPLPELAQGSWPS